MEELDANLPEHLKEEVAQINAGKLKGATAWECRLLTELVDAVDDHRPGAGMPNFTRIAACLGAAATLWGYRVEDLSHRSHRVLGGWRAIQLGGEKEDKDPAARVGKQTLLRPFEDRKAEIGEDGIDPFFARLSSRIEAGGGDAGLLLNQLPSSGRGGLVFDGATPLGATSGLGLKNCVLKLPRLSGRVCEELDGFSLQPLPEGAEEDHDLPRPSEWPALAPAALDDDDLLLDGPGPLDLDGLGLAQDLGRQFDLSDHESDGGIDLPPLPPRDEWSFEPSQALHDKVAEAAELARKAGTDDLLAACQLDADGDFRPPPAPEEEAFTTPAAPKRKKPARKLDDESAEKKTAKKRKVVKAKAVEKEPEKPRAEALLDQLLSANDSQDDGKLEEALNDFQAFLEEQGDDAAELDALLEDDLPPIAPQPQFKFEPQIPLSQAKDPVLDFLVEDRTGSPVPFSQEPAFSQEFGFSQEPSLTQQAYTDAEPRRRGVRNLRAPGYVDVRMLKRAMLERLADGRLAKQRGSFKGLLQQVRTGMPEQDRGQLTVPVAFVCMLHLCNEKALELEQIEALGDFAIGE